MIFRSYSAPSVANAQLLSTFCLLGSCLYAYVAVLIGLFRISWCSCTDHHSTFHVKSPCLEPNRSKGVFGSFSLANTGDFRKLQTATDGSRSLPSVTQVLSTNLSTSSISHFPHSQVLKVLSAPPSGARGSVCLFFNMGSAALGGICGENQHRGFVI